MRTMQKHESGCRSLWETATAVSLLALSLAACTNARQIAEVQNPNAYHDGGVRIIWCPGPPYRWTNCPPTSVGTDNPPNGHPDDTR